MDATRTKMEAWTTDAAQLRVKIDAQTQEWHFNVLRNQFDGVSRVNEKGLIRDYLLAVVESLPNR
jgi:acid stress-induced BolA-like protein IbaG/YrbA